MNILKE